jgi:hypothetical protein
VIGIRIHLVRSVKPLHRILVSRRERHRPDRAVFNHFKDSVVELGVGILGHIFAYLNGVFAQHEFHLA